MEIAEAHVLLFRDRILKALADVPMQEVDVGPPASELADSSDTEEP